MTTCTWTGAGHLWAWGDPLNWDPQVVPGEDDDVIVSPGPYYGSPDPAGTLVNSARLEAGCAGLQGLLRVKERFEWAGGVLEDGLNLGAAKLVITGNGGQRANADITSADTALRDGVVKMSTNARFINIGTLTSSGSCRLVWDGGGQPVLDSRGSLTVTAAR